METQRPKHQLAGWTCEGRSFSYQCVCGHSTDEWPSREDAQRGYLTHEQLEDYRQEP